MFTVIPALTCFPGELLAIQEIPVGGPGSDSIRRGIAMTGTTLEHVMREVNMMRSLQHENIVQYLGTSFDDGKLYILLEYVSGKNLT